MNPLSASVPRRPAAVAGLFYRDDARALALQVDACLAVAGDAGATAAPPKLLIVPHAGYVYSGVVAGRAYARLQGHAGAIRRVVLLGPAHRVALRGLAAPTVAAFETPLGGVALDTAALASLDALPQVQRSDAAHAQEHSLEVQLPFLQRTLGSGFRLVPLAVGDASPADVAEVLEHLWGGPETLIVISTDLSHFLPYAMAQQQDAQTAARIADRTTDLRPEEACGARALNGALRAARHHGLQPRLLDLRNSGDTAGDRNRVVGYAAFVADADGAKAEDEADDGLGVPLRARARNAIAGRLGLPAVAEPGHPALARPGATFVTLKDAAGRLRGCIGRLQADAALEVDVRRNALAAAFGDPRFAPLAPREWAGLRLSVSLLGPTTPMPPQPDAAAAARALRPSVDGVVVDWRGQQATFLPQVWQALPQPEAFLAALLRKAGLPAGFWAADVMLSRYAVRHFDDKTVPVGAAS